MTQTLIIPSEDGTPLRARFWPGQRSQGVLVIAHGLGEHSGCYESFASELTVLPDLADVVAFDFRGHGESAGRRGVVRRYEDLTADLRAVIRHIGRVQPGKPLIVLGHSNGGQVALHVLLESRVPMAGVILSNPALAIAAEIPAWKLLLGRLLLHVAPGVTLSAELNPEVMTRDESSWGPRRSDPLRHNRVSAPFFFGMLEGGARLQARAAEIVAPTLLILGGADRVVSPEASQTFFERLGSPDKTLHLHPDMRHEPLNELGREEVRGQIVDWLRRLLMTERSSSLAGA